MDREIQEFIAQSLRALQNQINVQDKKIIELTERLEHHVNPPRGSYGVGGVWESYDKPQPENKLNIFQRLLKWWKAR